MTEKERMLQGLLYRSSDPELQKEFLRARKITRLFNATDETECEKREELLTSLFRSVEKPFYIEPPFRCDYGRQISIGHHFYANFDCIMLDVCPIKIGNYVFLGPRVCLFTAAHPIDHSVRDTYLEYGKPITIGDHVWIGGNTVINPGVNIGDDVVIGSGSVITHDIPSHVVAAGNPCSVLRKITDEDRAYWVKLEDEYNKQM